MHRTFKEDFHLITFFMFTCSLEKPIESLPDLNEDIHIIYIKLIINDRKFWQIKRRCDRAYIPYLIGFQKGKLIDFQSRKW